LENSGIMGLFNKSPKSYETKQLCTNCNLETIINVPFGITIKDHILSGKAICQFCGCSIVKIVRPAPELPSMPVRPRPQSKQKKAKEVKEEEPEKVEEPVKDYGAYPNLDGGVQLEPW